MSNNNKKGLFSSKQVRSGGYSLIVTAIVLALVVFANLIVYILPTKFTSIDITDTGTFTLDAQTVDFVNALNNMTSSPKAEWILEHTRKYINELYAAEKDKQ